MRWTGMGRVKGAMASRLAELKIRRPPVWDAWQWPCHRLSLQRGMVTSRVLPGENDRGFMADC